MVAVAGWFLLLSDAHDELDAERAKEPALKQDYRAKLAQAVNLDELRKQKLQVEEYVTQLEKQLPGKAEMDALLSDINQAGLGRGLQFELFRPGQVVVKDYYAELPIAIKVSGRYHDIGSFAADVANLSRIVTLHNMVITPRQGFWRLAGDGSHCAHLPLPRFGRGRSPEEGSGQAGSEEMSGRLRMRRRRGPQRSVAVLMLAACGGEQDELQQWMEQQRREVKPSVQPLSPPKKFNPQPYAAPTASSRSASRSSPSRSSRKHGSPTRFSPPSSTVARSRSRPSRWTA